MGQFNQALPDHSAKRRRTRHRENAVHSREPAHGAAGHAGQTREFGARLAMLPTRTHHSCAFLKRSAFAITDMELNVIAALAIIGLRARPKKGYKMPAAIGTPMEL